MVLFRRDLYRIAWDLKSSRGNTLGRTQRVKRAASTAPDALQLSLRHLERQNKPATCNVQNVRGV